MRLLILTYGSTNHASSRIRALQYIPYFKKSGFNQISSIPRAIDMPKNIFGKWIYFPIAKRFLVLKTFLCLYFGNWDLIYVQRFFIKSNFLLNHIQKKNIPMIYDFDDAVFLDKENQKINYTSTSKMLKYATQVIVSTENLVPFCNQNNVNPIVITTPVDIPAKKTNKNLKDNFTIGWIGSSTTGKYIFSLKNCIEKTVSEKNIFWKIIGYKDSFLQNKNVQFENWSLDGENFFLENIDLGVMPLPDDEWARAKGGYKLLLYMSYGIPVIASPIGINKEIVQDGENGFLASSNEEWISRIYQLQSDKNLWKSMSEKAFQTIEKKYSREICYEKLDICIQQALKKNEH